MVDLMRRKKKYSEPAVERSYSEKSSLKRSAILTMISSLITKMLILLSRPSSKGKNVSLSPGQKSIITGVQQIFCIAIILYSIPEKTG